MSIQELKAQECLGLCLRARKKILVDTEAHLSDREIRETLLHEMAHAADRSKSRFSHGYGFFAQLEHLLRHRAPIGLKMTEMPGHRFPLSAVPRRFRLCYKAAVRLEKRRMAELGPKLRGKRVYTVSDEYILHQFEDAALELSWNQAKRAIGFEWGMIDVEGQPASAWARGVLERAKRWHDQVRRDYLAQKKMWKQKQQP